MDCLFKRMLIQRQKVLSLYSYVLCAIIVVLIYSVATSKWCRRRLTSLAKPSTSNTNSASVDSSLFEGVLTSSLHSPDAEI